MANGLVDVVVLAGGIAKWNGLPKASLLIGSETLLQHTIAELKAVTSLNRLAVVAPLQMVDSLPESVLFVQPKDDLWLNVVSGIEALSPSEEDFILLCAVDMPFLTRKSVQSFLDTAMGIKADLVYLAVPLKSLQKFLGRSEVYRTIVTLKEGTLTGGNLFFLKAKVLPSLNRLAKEAIKHRKNPIWLGRLTGLDTIIRFILRRLSVSDLERRAEILLGCRCKAIIADLPELAFDIDKPEDYELAQAIISERSNIID